MRLVRNNEDPKLIADLERLAGADAVAAVTPPEVLEADVQRLASTGSPGPVSGIEDPFVRRFVQSSVHLRKYAPFYAGAGLWLGAMLLVQPVGSGRSASADMAAGTRSGIAAPVAATSAAPAATLDVDTAASPTFDSFGGSTFDSADSDEFADFGSSEPADGGSSELAFEDDAAAFDEEFESFESFEDQEEEAPDPLEIIESGYASSTGGTPLEQPPAGGGLPITAAGGTTTKYSFVRLSGEDTTIALQEGDGNVNSETATLKMCPLTTSSWTGGPGKAMSAAPTYDDFCASGTRGGDGVWSFDLSSFTPIEGSNGFAIVPGSGTASTFQVVLKPSAVVVEEAGDSDDGA